MKKFIIRVGAYAILVCLLIFLLSLEMDNKDYKNVFMAAIGDKHRRLDSLQGPRLIFVGGSGTAFGINSEEVERELKIPVVNMAVMAGLGLDFILNEVEAKMRSGDIVVLSPEYYLDIEGSYDLKKFTAKCYPEAARYFKRNYVKDFTSVRFKQIKDNFKFLIDKVLRKKQASAIRPVDYITMYDYKSSFNEHGDVIAHLKIKPPPYLNDKGKLVYRYYNGIERINKFYQSAQTKNVKVVFVYHPYAASQYKLNEGTIQLYHGDLVRDLEVPVLGSPVDFVYEDSLFFDTILHLNAEGRELRTKKLVQLLSNAGIGQLK